MFIGIMFNGMIIRSAIIQHEDPIGMFIGSPDIDMVADRYVDRQHQRGDQDGEHDLRDHSLVLPRDARSYLFGRSNREPVLYHRIYQGRLDRAK